MRRQVLLPVFKIILALLGLSAVITEFAVLYSRGTLNTANFFSFFTVENNVLFAVVLLISAVAAIRRKHSVALDTVRAYSAVCMVIVGIGFALLLSGLKGVALTAVPWDNTVLHYIMPLAAIGDYLLDRPKSRLAFGRLAWVLVYPLGYGIYSLVRGHLTGWYPYPFLNVPQKGIGQLLIITAMLLILGLGLSSLAARWSGRLQKN